MGVEIATNIDGLNQNWPLGTDSKSEGDDHLRMIKQVIQAALGDDGTKITIKRPLTATGTLTATAVKTDWLSKTGVDMAAGWGAAGTPAGALDRFVINDKADGTGTNTYAFRDNGTLAITGTAPLIWARRGAAGKYWGITLGDTNDDLVLGNYDTAGALIGTPFTLKANGQVNVAVNLQVGSNLICGNMTAPGNALIQAGGSGAAYLRPSVGVTTAGTSDFIVSQFMARMQGSINATYGYNVQFGKGAAAGGNVFNIHYTGGATYLIIDNTNMGQFQFVSDYRTKKDEQELGDMWETVLALRPISYTQAAFDPTGENPDDPLFPADDIERWGFIAHELQETLTMSAANGAKDCANEIQSPNPWTVLAAVTCALQEAMRRIEELEAMVVP